MDAPLTWIHTAGCSQSSPGDCPCQYWRDKMWRSALPPVDRASGSRCAARDRRGNIGHSGNPRLSRDRFSCSQDALRHLTTRKAPGLLHREAARRIQVTPTVCGGKERKQREERAAEDGYGCDRAELPLKQSPQPPCSRNLTQFYWFRLKTDSLPLFIFNLKHSRLISSELVIQH